MNLEIIQMNAVKQVWYFLLLFFGLMCTKAICDEDPEYTQEDEHIFYVIC